MLRTDALLGETFDPTLVPGMTDEAFGGVFERNTPFES